MRIHLFHLTQSVSVYMAECVCLHCLFFLPSQMLGTGAAAWQWMHMQPLTLWSSLPAQVRESTELFLAVVAGAALTDVYKSSFSCHTVHHSAGGDDVHENVRL